MKDQTAKVYHDFIKGALPKRYVCDWTIQMRSNVSQLGERYFDLYCGLGRRCYIDFIDGKIRVNLRPDFRKQEQDFIYLDLVDPESQNKLRSLLKELI